MKIIQHKEPFFHTIIYDFYNDREEQGIWQELEFLNQPGKFLNKHFTGDGLASNNKLGLHLDKVYPPEYRHLSNMLTADRKIFEIRDQLLENPFAKYLEICDQDFSFISYYPDKSYYKAHFDRFTLSGITTLWKQPQKFTGGDLRFPKHDYIPDMRHNTFILFPSYELHEVRPIHIDKEWQEKGFSRYTLNQFMMIRES